MADSEALPTPETVAEWLDEEYNDHMEIYTRSDHVRLTPGSAGFYVDVYIPDGESFILAGERYGETIHKSCDATRDDLVDTLSKTI